MTKEIPRTVELMVGEIAQYGSELVGCNNPDGFRRMMQRTAENCVKIAEADTSPTNARTLATELCRLSLTVSMLAVVLSVCREAKPEETADDD
jgi:hypothetical protein